MEPTSEKTYSKLEWFLYIIVLPVIFISIITITLLWLLDHDIKYKILESLNQVPVIEKIIDDEELKKNTSLTMGNSKENLQITVDDIKKTLNEKNVTLTQYEQQMIIKDNEIASLMQQIDELKEQLEAKNISEKTREQEISDLVKVYTNMSTKNAANIISNLAIEEAVLLFSQMDTESKSRIFEKMDQKKAAAISILLKDMKYSKEQDIHALQERVNLLIKEIDKLKGNKTEKVDYEQLAATYSSMNPLDAANNLLYLNQDNPIKAQKILIAMDPVTRSKILSEMTSEMAAQFIAKIAE